MHNQRNLWLDNLRAVACLLVVLLHTAAPYLYKIQTLTTYQWQIGNIIDSFTRICVPLFFMISGYIFFREKKPATKNYIKLASAIVFYSLIYIAYIRYIDNNYDALSAIKAMMHKPVFYHLWFFYSIALIYAFANLVTIRANTSSATLCFVFILAFLYFNPIEFTGSPIGGIAYYALYAIFGAYLGQMQEITSKKIKGILIFTLIASSVFVAYKTSSLSFKQEKFISTYYSYISIPVVLGAFSVFMLLKNSAIKNQLIQRLLLLIAKNSLAIYGIHALFLQWFDPVRFYRYPILDISFYFLLTIILSLLFSILVKKIDKKGYVS